MIFVTVGTAQQPFNRLVNLMDDFAAHTDETVIIQAGTTTCEPQYAKYFRWTTSEEMEKLTKESRLVVTQASAGAIILAIKYHKPIIVVPRLSQYGENFDDHQSQLAAALQELGEAILLQNLTVAGLQEAMERAYNRLAVHSSREDLVIGLRQQLDEWHKQLKHKKGDQKLPR